MRPMTVLQILPALEGGGVERGVLEVAEALVAAGHRSLVVSAGGRMVAALESGGSQHIPCPVGRKSPWTLRWVPWLRQLLLRERVEVIDIHSRLPGWIAWLAWNSLPAAQRPRLVSSFHGLHSVSPYSSIMCRGERVIVVSRTLQQHVRQHYAWVPEERLRLVPRGIDISEFPRGYQPDDAWRSQFHAEFPQLAAAPVLTLAGRVSRLKGHPDFLQLLADLRDRGLVVQGLIVGEAAAGRERYVAELQTLAVRLGVGEQVCFAGHRTDLKQIYAASSVVLSLSQKPEAFGRTVAEALAVGTPVVGYDLGGVGEILAAQFAEGRVPYGDRDRLQATVARVLQGRDAPQIGPNCFDRRVMLQQTLAVYQELRDERTTRAA